MRSLSVPDTSTSICIIGIGNTLAGDDGAGIIALNRLRLSLTGTLPKSKLPDFECMNGDLYAVIDFCSPNRHLLFLDAVCGSRPGELVTITGNHPETTPPSLHQLDICTVMQSLQHLEICDPFPSWEVRGITVTPPEQLKEGLSPEVEKAVDQLVGNIAGELSERIG